MNARTIIATTATLFVLVLSGCNNQTGLDAAAHTATDQMERTAAIGALVHNYDQARAAQQWDLALSYASALQRIAPNNALASTVQATLSDTNMHADEVHDKNRLAALWSYHVTELSDGASDGMLVSASIKADSKPDPADSPATRLVLRKHPKLGRSVNLVLDHGEFDCAPGCKVQVRFDDQPARAFAASASDVNRQALSIDDEQTIRDSLDKVRVITVDTSIDGKPHSLTFAVGGFDRVQLEQKMQ